MLAQTGLVRLSRLELRNLVALGIALWLALSGVVSAEELQLGVLHVNDTHGHLLPFRLLREDGWGGFARLSAALERQRADTSCFWLTLHAGDAFQAAPLPGGLSQYIDHSRLSLVGLGALWGAPLSNALAGSLDLECMSVMGFDAMCLGNHEFDFGCDMLRTQLAAARFPILSANVLDRTTGTPLAAPYIIARRGDYDIGIIGLTTETLGTEDNAELADQIAVHAAAPTAQALAEQLRSAGCAVVIVLSHLGFGQDLELASSVTGVDVIVGGHSHTFLEQPALVEAPDGHLVVVTQDGCYGEELGVLRLKFTREDSTRRFQLLDYSAMFVPLKPSEPEDDGIVALVAEFERCLRSELGHAPSAVAQDPPATEAQLNAAMLADIATQVLRNMLQEARSCLARAHRAYLQ